MSRRTYTAPQGRSTEAAWRRRARRYFRKYIKPDAPELSLRQWLRTDRAHKLGFGPKRKAR